MTTITRRAALLSLLPAAAQAQNERRDWPRTRPTPALKLPRLDAGGTFDLAAARGQVVLLNFWASWCEPCRAELPSLELLATRHEAHGLLVLAVNFKESEAAIRRFADNAQLDLPVLRDPDGAAARAFGVRVFPSSVLVSRDGRAAFTITGETDWARSPAREWVDALI